MNFDLDDSQRELESTINRYFSRTFDLSRVRQIFDRDEVDDQALWRDLGELGLFAILIPTEYGGSDGELLDVAVAAECLGLAAAPGAFLGHVLATLAIVLAGDDSQRTRWLPGLATGAIRATLAVGEGRERWWPDALEFDVSELRGRKSWVLGASTADVMVVVARDGLAVVDARCKGVSIQPADGIDRTRRFSTVVFDRPYHERLSGDPRATDRVLDAGAVLLAADAYGGAAYCLRAATEYAKQREQFGVTIAHFQAIKHQLADMALEVEPSRALYWYAAHAWNNVPADASRFASLAKAHITDRFLSAARRATEIHGGIGYTWECDLHLYLRRAVFDRAYLGAPAFHRERYAHLSGWSTAA
jgi:alkylation response protein AidB-like acyl-CoA dehydrogenase